MKHIALIALVALLCCGCGPNRLRKAEDLVKNKAYAEASKLIEEEILDNPGNGRAYFLKAKVAYNKDDSEGFTQSIDQALTADANLKEEVARWLLEIGKGALPEAKETTEEEWEPESPILPEALSKAYELKPDLFDEDTCYRWWVLAQLDEKKFLDKFPTSPRAPKLMLTAAERAFEYDRSQAKEWYQKLSTEFPKTEEGKKAKERLSDWWERTTTTLPLDRNWHSIISLKKGTAIRLRVTGNARIDMGAFGYHDITPTSVIGYMGNNPRYDLRPGMGWGHVDQDTVRAAKRMSTQDIERIRTDKYATNGRSDAADWEDLQKNYILGGTWYGVATQAGSLYLRVDSNAFQTTFSVEVEWKEP